MAISVETLALAKKYADNNNCYSETETKIGTWIDGKPLYRKVIDFINGAINPSAMGTYCDMTSYVSNLNIKQYIDVKVLNPDYTMMVNCGAWVSNGTHYLLSPIIFSASANNKKLIIEYTKTTD